MTMPNTLPRAILYDWDNTLADNWDCVHAALNATLTAFGHTPWTMDETLARVRRSMRDSFPLLFGDRWPEARDIFYDHYATHYQDHVKAMPGADALLKAVAARNVYQALVSNKSGRFLRVEANLLGWTAQFGAMVGAGDAEADKPHPAPVVQALDPHGLSLGAFTASDVWFVGDAAVDMECAHRSGCMPILLGAGLDDDLETYPPAVRVDDCRALTVLVNDL